MTRILCAVVALAVLPGVALAHIVDVDSGIGAGEAFLYGLLHPLTGLDHLIAMVAVGLWAASLWGRSLWALPAGFVGAMALGGVMGNAGFWLPAVEPVILASVIVLGAALALALRPAMAVSLAMVALFGLAHGHAHGVEGPGVQIAGYGIGFVAATVVLHAAGLAAGLRLARGGHWLGARVLGGAAALTGAVMIWV